MATRRHATLLAVWLLAATSGAAAENLRPNAGVGESIGAQVTSHYRDDAPGAVVLVARGDDVLYRGARGLADVEHRVPLSPDQSFLLGSVSKQLVAVGVLKLVASGQLSLESSLAEFVPDYPNGGHITIRDLLGHTSGIRSYTEMPSVTDGPIWKDATIGEIIDSFKDATPLFEPGKGFGYSNSNYVLAAAVIESVGHVRWYDYLQQTFFDPLGMSRTSCNPRPASSPTRVRGYSLDDSGVVAATGMNMTWASGAAGCTSTADDLLKWNRALHHGLILDDRTYREMLMPSDIEGGEGYGLGMQIGREDGRTTYGHDGVINGFMSSMVYVPATDLFVVALENSDGGPSGEGPTAFVKTLAALATEVPSAAAK